MFFFFIFQISLQCWNVLCLSKKDTEQQSGWKQRRPSCLFPAQSAISVPPFLTRCPNIKVSDILPCLHSFVPLSLPVCSHGLLGNIGKKKKKGSFSFRQSFCFICRRLVEEAGCENMIFLAPWGSCTCVRACACMSAVTSTS